MARAPGDLEIDENLAVQKREAQAESIGQGFLAAFLLAALLGLFGGGPFSQATAGADDSALRVEYARFSRMQASTDLKVYARPQVTQDGTTTVSFTQESLQDVQVVAISPAALDERGGSGLVRYRFRLVAGEPAVITFRVKVERAGLRQSRVQLDSGPAVEFQQWVYP